MKQGGFIPIIILLVLIGLGIFGYFSLFYKTSSQTLNLATNSPTLVCSPNPYLDANKNWKTYTDSDNIFSIKYPSEWYYFGLPHDTSETAGGKFVLFSSTLGNTSPQTRTPDEDARLYITFTPNTKSENVRDWLQDSELLKYGVREVNISGKNALRISPPPGVDDTGLSTYIYTYITTPKWHYTFVGAISNNSKFESMSEIIFKMLDSATIND